MYLVHQALTLRPLPGGLRSSQMAQVQRIRRNSHNRNFLLHVYDIIRSLLRTEAWPISILTPQCSGIGAVHEDKVDRISTGHYQRHQ